MHIREEFEMNRTDYLKTLPKECANCGETSDLDIHHIVPLVKGETNRISNMVMLCLECHGRIYSVNRVKHKELQIIGIEKAKERGVYKGKSKKCTETSESMKQALGLFKDRKNNGYTVKKICNETGVSRTVLYEVAKEKGIV
ncbi:HNH endonuclease [Bacillus thuringiensis]|uniref:HNH endonuclease n=1 Tax=Bacillus thuringiensis TaxID=1428 RepID=UPI000CD8CB1B|nr:HNH endonuclease [Bacillus thuringiensis]QFQ28872.1 HNH endonuclease [Bacillus thuringiensis]